MAVVMLSSAACVHEDTLIVAAPIAPPRKPSTTGASQNREPRDMAGVSVHMERKACYGICPSYFVDITGDGQVTYLGREFVGVRGQKKGTADLAQVNRLMDAVDHVRLDKLVNAPTCASIETDQAVVIVSVRDKGATTKVTHNLGNACYPSGLADVEAMIDDVASTEQWVRCETGFCMH